MVYLLLNAEAYVGPLLYVHELIIYKAHLWFIYCSFIQAYPSHQQHRHGFTFLLFGVDREDLNADVSSVLELSLVVFVSVSDNKL